MATYATLDYLPDLTAREMANAGRLGFTPYTVPSVGWDVRATVSGSDSNALLHDLYKFDAVAGATYDIFSTSYFDPFLLRVYDAAGNTIVANDESDDGADIWLGDAYYAQDVIHGWVAPYTGSYYVAGNWDQGSYYSYYSLTLYGDLDTAPPTLPVAITGTARADTLTGNALDNQIQGLGGNDILVGGAGNDRLDGGAGIDTARYAGKRADFSIIKTAAGWTVIDLAGAEGTDTLVSIERLQFADARIALDIDGNAGQAYRLYQAAFDRTPDSAGLAYHMGTLDGGAALATVAQGFITSPEFARTYGTLNNTQFVTQLYANVLHRAPDAGGLDFYLQGLGNGSMGRAQTLVGFSESAENQANVVGVIGAGIVY